MLNQTQKLLTTVCLSASLVVVPSIKSSAEPASDWGYGGAGNPTRWAELSPEYKLCEAGRDQSPVNFDKASSKNLGKIEYNYQPSTLEVVNTGHTIQVNYPKGSSIKINGKLYELLQFHFHTPSEHTVDEEAYALEGHLVHRNQEGRLAVVGVFIKEGNQNSFLESIWQNLPEAGKSKKVSNVKIDASRLLPASNSYYSYEGSLTTPPCSEGVTWIVMKTPIEASKEQIAKFVSLYEVNARPVQPINGRQIWSND